MAGGRPSKYDEAYCQQLVDHMATGASATSFAAEIDVHRDTLSEWANVHPEFSVALARGKAKCAAWWEVAARSAALDGKGSATMIVFGLKNMSADDWHDKQEIEHSATGDLAAIIAQRRAQVASVDG